MTTTRVAVLIPAKTIENSQTTQYTSNGVYTRIDKITATNYDTVTRTVSVNIVTNSDTAGNQNLIVKTKDLQPAETYTFPELVNTLLEPGGFISTLASAASAINMRANGLKISST